MQSAPIRFCVALGTDTLRANEDICMEIMNSDYGPILHVVDTATKLSVARVLSDLNAGKVWGFHCEMRGKYL